MTARSVQLPPQSLDKCSVCSKTESLRLCSSCGEQIYCSPECQKSDWFKHRVTCGKTDRISLSTFYPFFACLFEANQFSKPTHKAVTHGIINSPGPGTNPTLLPDGSAANLILLGDLVEHGIGSEEWWPSAPSPLVRSKLFRRIWREGYVLPNLVAICTALLAEMYTTTYVAGPSSKPTQRRTRLQYHSSPIVDFGIAKGRAEVKNQDKLAYFYLCSPAFEKGQDNEDHYWLYFTTLRGEEITLDCAIFTFNFCLIVATKPYSLVINRLIGRDVLARHVPAFYRDRVFAKNAPNLQQATERFSFLRYKPLHELVTQPGSIGNVDVLFKYMEKIAGRSCTPLEKDLMIKWAGNNSQAMEALVEERAWTSWPSEPKLGIEQDPGEMDGISDSKENEEAWFKFARKWHRKYNRGEISVEALGNAFRAWEQKHSRPKRQAKT